MKLISWFFFDLLYSDYFNSVKKFNNKIRLILTLIKSQ